MNEKAGSSKLEAGRENWELTAKMRRCEDAKMSVSPSFADKDAIAVYAFSKLTGFHNNDVNGQVKQLR